MPSMKLTIRWPNGEVENIYSPSSIVSTYFQQGETFSLDQFMHRCMQAFNHASQREAQQYGDSCTSALATLGHVQNMVAALQEEPGEVMVLRMR